MIPYDSVAFTVNNVQIVFRPAEGVGRLEVYAINLCMEKLVQWGHEYSFGQSGFEYWVTEDKVGKGTYKKGVGEISWRRR